VDWDWVYETALGAIGGTFTFARGASPEQMMTAFGMNPARARLVPASDVAQALHDPDWLRTEPPEHPWIRVGVAGEWGFALDESSAGYGGYEDAPAGTEAVLLTHTQTIDDFRYADDGTLVTSFEPGMLDRYGTEPDRFVEQMRQVGLPTTISDDRAVDPMIALLQMLTVALGIWIPRDLALGPLLTVQRETALPCPQPQPRPQFTTEPLTQAWQLRSHLQRLIDGGVTHDAIYAQSGYRLSKHSIDAILRGAGTFRILAETAEQVLAIEVPPNA
jgi:hypothetical protein